MRRYEAKIARWMAGVLPAALGVVACSTSGNAPSAPPAIGKLTVTWVAPTKNSDGTPLTDLSGYTIRYGRQPHQYTGVIRIDDPKATRYVVTGLQPGTWYFAISTNNAAGGHSTLSGEVSGVAK